MKSAADVLQTLLQNSKSPLAQQFVRWRLWRYWADVVGPQWAAVSKPVEFDRGRLIIWVASSSHLQEMNYILEPLALKINHYLGRSFVSQIRLTQDRRALKAMEDDAVKEDLNRLDK